MKSDIELHWEWPDNRVPSQRIPIQVSDIKKTSKGLFGFKNSPSYAFNYPNSTDLIGTIISGDQHTKGKTLKLTLPLEEIKTLKVGDTVELGIIDSTACISVSPIGNTKN